MHGPDDELKRKRRKLTAARVNRHRKLKLACYNVTAPKDDLIRALRFRGLPARATKRQIDEKLSELVTEIARRWREVLLP
jgi:hypothetical protein